MTESKYLAWDEHILNSGESPESWYTRGYLATRKSQGYFIQTRSVRIDLNKFALSSENRRVFRKTADLTLSSESLPYANYHWQIGKLARDFYTRKFGPRTFSANKIKELLTDNQHSNFNRLFIYQVAGKEVGYAIALETSQFIHYAYPFYQLETVLPNLGLGMMLHAIVWAKENSKKHFYLGSAQRPEDIYKLQFIGLEWFDGQNWQQDLGALKLILKKA